MTARLKIQRWIMEHQMKLRRSPSIVPISEPEHMEILSDYHYRPEDGANKVCGFETEYSPWAEMTRHRILEMGVERFSVEQQIDESAFRLHQFKDTLTDRVVQILTARILADVTHLDVSFDWDRLAWLKRRVKWIGRKWPVKRKSVRIEGKVLCPYLKIQAPADTHRVRLICRA